MSAVVTSNAAPSAPQGFSSEKELMAAHSMMKQELQALMSKISELEMDREEHAMVINVLAPLPAERVCHRLVGGVLVQRTVKEILPALKNNQEQIGVVVKQLAEKYKQKEDELAAFQRRYGIVPANSSPEEIAKAQKISEEELKKSHA